MVLRPPDTRASASAVCKRDVPKAFSKTGSAGRARASYLWRELLPTAPTSQACPMGTQFDGTRLRIRWQHRNPSSAYQPAVSILAGEMGTQMRPGTFCFCPCITLEPSASTQNPLCISLLRPKGEGRGRQILSLHNTPGKVSVFVDGGCKTCTLVTGAAGTYQQR